MKFIFRRPLKTHKRTWLIATAVGVLLFLGAAAAWAYSQKNNRSVATQTTNKDNEDKTAPEQVVTPDPNVPGGSQDNRPEDYRELVAPTGAFVSHHSPSLSGQGGPKTMVSSCVVGTPEAHCLITFSKNGVTRQLKKKQVDDSGTAVWQWDVADLGLTPGKWTVGAVASYDDQTKTTKDPLVVEVKP